MTENTMPAFVAGYFYPKDHDELESTLKKCFSNAVVQPSVPKAIIAPHAGYVYSGDVAANAYASLEKSKDKIKRVVLFAPAHRYPFVGIATTHADEFATPLGSVSVDKDAVNESLKLDAVKQVDEAFFNEHALEVHLPFLQHVLTDFKIVPFIVGDAFYDDVKSVIEALWGDDETLIVVSSDLSHYHSYESAKSLDYKTAEAILNLDPNAISNEQACGRTPIKGLLSAARDMSLSPKLIDLKNSGDTAGSKDKVVGYGAFHFLKSKEAAALDEVSKKQLLELANQSIDYGLENNCVMPLDLKNFSQRLQEKGACFVTLTIDDVLRGCIGTLAPYQSLAQDVVEHAFAAAFQDARFNPLKKEEREKIAIKLSVLNPAQPLVVTSEQHLIEQLKPGIDGLILTEGQRRATFLPSVWSSLTDPALFLQHLKVKAGLPADYWSDSMRFLRYTVEEI